MIELQDYERQIEPDLPPGSSIVDSYVEYTMAHCRTSDGTIFVAEVDGRVTGYVNILTRMEPDDPADPIVHAFILDLIVLPAYRGQGFGRALMEHAERHARQAGASILRVGVLARNQIAHQLYLESGFSERYVELSKSLD